MFRVSQTKQTVRSGDDYATLLDKATKVVQMWKVLVLQMGVPHSIRMTPDIVFITVVHTCRCSPVVRNTMRDGDVSRELFLVLEYGVALVPEALVCLCLVQVVCDVPQVRSTRFSGETMVATVPKTSSEKLELNHHTFPLFLHLSTPCTLEQVTMHLVHLKTKMC